MSLLCSPVLSPRAPHLPQNETHSLLHGWACVLLTMAPPLIYLSYPPLFSVLKLLPPDVCMAQSLLQVFSNITLSAKCFSINISKYPQSPNLFTSFCIFLPHVTCYVFIILHVYCLYLQCLEQLQAQSIFNDCINKWILIHWVYAFQFIKYLHSG